MHVFKRPPKKIIKRTYYSNGKLRSKGVSMSDDMSRVWTMWYKNGQKKCRGIYTNHTKDGSKWTYWHDNGMKKCEGTLIRLDHHKKWISTYKIKTGLVGMKIALKKNS